MAKKILIIEDYPDTIMLLTEMFTPLGYQIIYALDGHSGIEEARKMQPDLILLDIMMPAMNGFEVCETLKADPKTVNIPVVIISVRSSAEDIHKGLGVGAIGYVTKPFDLGKLEAVVREQLQ